MRLRPTTIKVFGHDSIVIPDRLRQEPEREVFAIAEKGLPINLQRDGRSSGLAAGTEGISRDDPTRKDVCHGGLRLYASLPYDPLAHR
jgi:hypothetical protein